MELDVTHMVKDCDDMPNLSGSVAELGQDASKITWRNSIEYAKANPLLATEDARDEARAWLKDFGAWEAEEIAGWSDTELNALVVQFIAGDIREMEHYDSEDEFREACESGRASGRLYRGDNGRWYFYLGN
jgi:hypothetical protein